MPGAGRPFGSVNKATAEIKALAQQCVREVMPEVRLVNDINVR